MKLVLMMILSILFCISNSELFILTDTGTFAFTTASIQYFNPDSKTFESDPYAINATFVLGDDADVEGKIVLMPFVYGIDTLAKEFQSRGAVALVMASDHLLYVGRGGYRLESPREPNTMPTAEINDVDLATVLELFEGGQVIWASLESTTVEENIYAEPMKTYGTFFLIFGALFFGPTVVISFILLVLQLNHQFKINVRVLILTCVFLTSILRLCYTVINPAGSLRTTSWPFIIFIHIFNIPLTLISELLVSIFWFEIMSSLVKKKKFLTSTRIPIMIICIFFVILISISAVIAIVDAELMNNMISIMAALYTICVLGLSIFHFVTAIIFYRIIAGIKKRASLKKNNLTFIIKVIFICIMDFLTIATLIAAIFTSTSITFSISSGFILVVLTGFHSIIILSLFDWNPKSTSTNSQGNSTRKGSTATQEGERSQ